MASRTDPKSPLALAASIVFRSASRAASATAAAGGLLPSADTDLNPTSPTGLDPLSQATNAVAHAFMERTPFAIDDAGDEEDDDDDEEESEQDDVLDEVDAFLEAHDTGVTDADREVAKDLRTAEPM